MAFGALESWNKSIGCTNGLRRDVAHAEKARRTDTRSPPISGVACRLASAEFTYFRRAVPRWPGLALVTLMSGGRARTRPVCGPR